MSKTKWIGCECSQIHTGERSALEEGQLIFFGHVQVHNCQCKARKTFTLEDIATGKTFDVNLCGGCEKRILAKLDSFDVMNEVALENVDPEKKKMVRTPSAVEQILRGRGRI